MIADVSKMVATYSDEQALVTVLRTMEPKLRRRFLEIVRWLRDRKSTAEIVALITAGRSAEIVDATDLSRAGAALAEAIHAVYLAAAREVARGLAETLDTIATFDATNWRAVRAMNESALRLVRDLTAEQTSVVRRVLADGVARGINPRAVAREIRASIGLTPKQLDHVQNYRRQLERGSRDALDRHLRDRRFDRTVARAVESGRPLTTAEIDRMVDRYRERYLKFRSEVIARTEGIAAVHEGAEELWRQAIDAGEVDAAELERTWVTTHDGRTRASHLAMGGQKQRFGNAFMSGDGYRLRYPHDPSAPASETIQCRCAVVTRFAAAAEQSLAAAA